MPPQPRPARVFDRHLDSVQFAQSNEADAKSEKTSTPALGVVRTLDSCGGDAVIGAGYCQPHGPEEAAAHPLEQLPLHPWSQDVEAGPEIFVNRMCASQPEVKSRTGHPAASLSASGEDFGEGGTRWGLASYEDWLGLPPPKVSSDGVAVEVLSWQQEARVREAGIRVRKIPLGVNVPALPSQPAGDARGKPTTTNGVKTSVS